MIRHVKGNIWVTKVPGGEAPLEVREKWVGLVLPIVGISSNAVHDVLSLKETNLGGLHYLVPQELAIAILEKHDIDAAHW